ncbi:MAG: hypothetical protein N5P05_003819 [Chroococcopsis gigantea SAG 12.99]|jgi:uncharacterized membrane protein YkoI|nr:PepSY domain-containing protein [Chlorogloea purpurea SAG 13.99]MDV3002213.1 hypothetical protein [Chroococcopsis gigantea SAG 12.99]
MKNITKLAVTIGLLGSLGASILVRNVVAQTTSPAITITEKQGNTEINDRNLAQAGQNEGDTEVNDGNKDDDAKETQEATRLQSLAKISLREAQTIAEKSLGGRATKVHLENEDGNVVYSVHIGLKEVKVDAGNGKILLVEDLNKDEENTSYRSSIRVPDNGNDGEN